MPHVLVVDDDPISLRFLEAALTQLGCASSAATDTEAALAAATTQTPDLLLLDRRMPGGGGSALLAQLRRRGIAAPAIATSAALDAAAVTELSAAGFAAVIEKPITLAGLHSALSPYLPTSPAAAGNERDASAPALLDDAAALTVVGGDSRALRALRELLAEELAIIERDLADAVPVAFSERLHRLTASCGFCGARQLASAAAALQRALRADPDELPDALQGFVGCCRATLAALRKPGELVVAGGARAEHLPGA